MKNRKLRIAWSVAWGIVAVLFVVLWVRSYWRTDIFSFHPRMTASVICQSRSGSLTAAFLTLNSNSQTTAGTTWYYRSKPLSVESADVTPSNLLAFGTTRRVLTNGIANLFRLPEWFCFVAVASIAAMPWFRWSNRFSLRTLLIATTLFAILLGLIVWLTSK
jgi:hypothetical protein